MIIQHNIPALNSYRQLSGNNNALAKNLERLSSGYKVNRAGDDAAGLAISEKMRAQIKGLQTASKNAQDGISVIQTAEGALTEVHSMLNRMVELATQAANGIYGTEERKNLQMEIDKLNEEIDRIANNTDFNGTRLLNGEIGGLAAVAKTEGTPAGGAGSAATIVLNLTGIGFTPGNADNTVTLDFGGGATLVSDQAGGTSAMDVDAVGALFVGKTVTIDGQTFTAGYASGSLTLTAGANASVSFTPASVTVDVSGTGAPADPTLTTATPVFTNGAPAGGPAVAGTTSIALTSQPKAGDTITIGDKTYEFIESGGSVKGAGNTSVTIGADQAASLTALQSAVSGDAPTDVTVGAISNGAFVVTNAAADPSASVNVTSKGGGLILQVGDTMAQTITVTVSNMDSSSLGVGSNAASKVDLSSVTTSNAAIDVIKTAISTVSTERANLGALQNRLEHTINNLGVTTENITAAESRIRDTDMAKEMMEYTKNNILVQAAQAMLAQANQVPQGVLQLLR